MAFAFLAHLGLDVLWKRNGVSLKSVSVPRRSSVPFHSQQVEVKENQEEDQEVEEVSHHSSGLVVVQVHLLALVPTAFSGVHKVPGEFDAEADVVRAASPLPVSSLGILRLVVELVAVVASARLDRSLAARLRH